VTAPLTDLSKLARPLSAFTAFHCHFYPPSRLSAQEFATSPSSSIDSLTAYRSTGRVRRGSGKTDESVGLHHLWLALRLCFAGSRRQSRISAHAIRCPNAETTPFCFRHLSANDLAEDPCDGNFNTGKITGSVNSHLTSLSALYTGHPGERYTGITIFQNNFTNSHNQIR
jgi:hypothetical protein